MDTTNARMMLGYMEDDDDEILDYDGNLDLSTDNEDEDEAESVADYANTMPQYPETPDEKIHWQEQIRMIHLRSHLNQLMEKVRQAHYVTDKTREELKKCRSQIQQYETERDQLFSEIQTKDSEGNKSAVHRVRAAHQRVCAELEGEQKLEQMIIDRLDQAEYELALAEVERGKFLLAEDDLLQREHKLSQEKTDMAMVRLAKEETLARQALTLRRKEDRNRRDIHLDAARRHTQAIEEAERSHERANKYLQKTLDKLKQRENEEAERYKTDMSKKMDMLLKLKNDITHNRENLKAIRARDRAAEKKEKSAEFEERERIKIEGGNPEEMLLVKKRKNEMEKQRQVFEAEQKVKKAAIMQKILREEENMKKRKLQQPHLWGLADSEKRVKPHVLKPVQALNDYVAATADEAVNVSDVDKDQEMLNLQKKYEANEEIRCSSHSLHIWKPPKQKIRQKSKDSRDSRDSRDECEGDDTVTESLSLSSSGSFSDNEDYRRLLKELSRQMRKEHGSKLPSPIASKESIIMTTKDNGKRKSIVPQGSQATKNKNQNQEVDGDTEGEEVENAMYNDNAMYDIAEEKTEDMLDQSELDAAVAMSEGEDLTMDVPGADQVVPEKDSDFSDSDEEMPPVDLARPEFEGLWDKETKPYRIPKDSDHHSAKPLGGSKMDQEILKQTLEKTREGIVITQVAAGREFSGCPFYSKPDVIHFKDFVVGKTYKKKVTLTNVSYTVNYIKFLDITERLKDFIKIHFDPPGQMSAGLTCDMIVTFRPMINEDLQGEVNFLTQTGPFHIPLICSTKKCDLVLDTTCVDFGTTVIGETLKRSFTLTNRGALGTKFDFFKVTGMKQRTLTTAGTSLGRMEVREQQQPTPPQVSGTQTHLDVAANPSLTTPVVVPAKKKSKAEAEGISTPQTQEPVTDDGVPTVKDSKAILSTRESNIGVQTQTTKLSLSKLAMTSLETTDSMRAVSPDSANDIDPSKVKQATGTGSSVAVDSKKKSEEALDKIPEAGEMSIPPLDEVGGDGAGTSVEHDGIAGEATGDASEQKQDGESEEAMSPDLAVSEMEEYTTLDGMRVGPLASGEIGPFSSLRLEIVWQPTLPGKVDPEFLVSFADPLSEPLSIRAVANAIDVPVWVERQSVDLKICMFDRLYQDTIIVNNRATTALRLKFEVCKELRNHLELLPKTGYIQAQSQFSAQLKFLPRQSLFEEAAKYFDPETGVLEAPMTIRVADQTTPVHFTVQAVVTTSDMEFDVTDIDFGYCTIHESVRRTVRLTNHSILPQQFGFMGLPEYIEVQPNDGFGTLLPLETLELDVIFSPTKTREHKLDLVCRSIINRDFKISVCGVGVLTPLELTHQVVHFGATPLYDTTATVLHVVNSHTSSNEFTHPVPRIGKGEICPVGPTSFEFVVPKDSPVTVSPCVGTVQPGKASRIQVRFSPTLNDYDVRQEALRIHNRLEAQREEKERLEAEEREKKEAEEKAMQILELKRQDGKKDKDKDEEKEKKKKKKDDQKDVTQSNVRGTEEWEASTRYRRGGRRSNRCLVRGWSQRQKEPNPDFCGDKSARCCRGDIHYSLEPGISGVNLGCDEDMIQESIGSESSSNTRNRLIGSSQEKAFEEGVDKTGNTHRVFVDTSKCGKHLQVSGDEDLNGVDAVNPNMLPSDESDLIHPPCRCEPTKTVKSLHTEHKSAISRENYDCESKRRCSKKGLDRNLSGKKNTNRSLLMQVKSHGHMSKGYKVLSGSSSDNSILRNSKRSKKKSKHKSVIFSPDLEVWEDLDCVVEDCNSPEISDSQELKSHLSVSGRNKTNSAISNVNQVNPVSHLPPRPPRMQKAKVRNQAKKGNVNTNAKAADEDITPQKSDENLAPDTEAVGQPGNIDGIPGNNEGIPGNEDVTGNIDLHGIVDQIEDMEDEGEDAPAGKGKNKGKASPKGTQSKTNKLSAAPSSHGSAITTEGTPRFDPDKLSRDSPEYQAAITSLVRQFKGQFRSLTIPCYVASGQTGNPGELKYSIHNTLYLEVHCPAVRPPVVVISDSGKRVVDFGDVSIGQTCPRSVTVQNISEKDVELTATPTNPTGPFLMLNALRTLPPGATHTLLLTFGPGQGQVFQEELGIKTFNSTLHLTLRGRGVNPLVNLNVEEGVFDLSAVLVGEFVEKHFKVENTSTLAIDYVIKQDSLSPLRHARAQSLPTFLSEGNIPHNAANYVGTQNDNGKNVFDIVPTKGTIQAGETKEIMVTFAPDHESDLYSDGVRLELFDQEESHFFQVLGQAKPRVMFLEGADPLRPEIESLALQPALPEEEDPEERKPKYSREGKGVVVSPPALVTIRSVASNDSFQPGVREIYAGCVRTMAVSQKKPGKTNGEFAVEGIQALLQKGFTVEPQKGMVEAGAKKPIVFTWTPPAGYDPSVTIEETAVLTLKCDVTEQITLMIRASVVTE